MRLRIAEYEEPSNPSVKKKSLQKKSLQKKSQG